MFKINKLASETKNRKGSNEFRKKMQSPASSWVLYSFILCDGH